MNTLEKTLQEIMKNFRVTKEGAEAILCGYYIYFTRLSNAGIKIYLMVDNEYIEVCKILRPGD